MSYILDALKQSDSQRKREPAQDPVQAAIRVRPRSRSRGRGRLGWLFLLLVVLGALVWWQRWGEVEPITAPSPVAKDTPAEAVERPAAAAVEAPRPSAVAVTPAPLDADELKGVRIRLEEPAARPAPEPRPDVAAAPVAERPEAPAVVEDEPPAIDEEPAAAAPSNPYADVPYWRQLPVDVQRSLPELKFSVHIYSGDPASRRVKVGERMLREGQRITPQVRLEEIIPKGVILSYQDYRFRMNAL